MMALLHFCKLPELKLARLPLTLPGALSAPTSTSPSASCPQSSGDHQLNSELMRLLQSLPEIFAFKRQICGVTLLQNLWSRSRSRQRIPVQDSQCLSASALFQLLHPRSSHSPRDPPFRCRSANWVNVSWLNLLSVWAFACVLPSAQIRCLRGICSSIRVRVVLQGSLAWTLSYSSESGPTSSVL